MAEAKLLMFDFDGVIADSLDVQSGAFVETMTESGLDHLATPEHFLDFLEDNWFAALAAAGVPHEVAGQVDDSIGELPSPELFPGMAAVVERLAAAHTVIVITSSRTDHVERVLQEHGVKGVADVIGADKDESKTRRIRAARSRFAPGRPAWYVGDTVGDIIEAREAGVCTVGAAWGWHGPERLGRVQPDHLAHEPQDLLDLFPA
jgi:phosphoglycolate phosphatase